MSKRSTQLKRDYSKLLIDAIFQDFTPEERKSIGIEHQRIAKPKLTIAYAEMPEHRYLCTVKLCNTDTFNEITGATLALSKLREKIVSTRSNTHDHFFSKKYHPWIPEDGQLYYTIEPCGGKYKIIKQQWCEHGSQTNMIDLKTGIVFKTEWEARKYIRKREYEGRVMNNYWRKYYDSCKARSR